MEHRERRTPPAPGAVLDRAGDLTLVVDGGGTILYASDAARAMLGHLPAERLGTSVFDLIHPEDRAVALESLVGTAASGGGVKVPLELRALHADGSWRPVEIVASNLLADPDVGGVVVTVRDVAARRSAAVNVHEVERRLDEAFDAAAIGMALLDLEGRYLRVNEALARLLGLEPETLVGRSFREFTHPDDTGLGGATMAGLVAGNGGGCVVEKRYLRPDGGVAWAQVTLSVVQDERGGPLYLSGQFVDTTAQHEAEQARRAGDDRYRRLFEAQRDAIVVVDRSTFDVIDANTAAQMMYGYSAAEMRGMPVLAFSVDRDSMQAALRGVLEDAGRRSLVTTRHRRVDGREFPAEITCTALEVDGAPALALIVRDVTELAAARDRLEDQPRHDPLTDLPNRVLFREFADQALARAGRTGSGTSVLLVDLDDFDAVNGALGTEGGDAVLVEAARRLRSTVRRGDVVARYDGDAFVVLCEDADEAQAVGIAERIVDALARPVAVGARAVELAASVGFAIGWGGRTSVELLLQDADAALARAKRDGHGRVEARLGEPIG